MVTLLSTESVQFFNFLIVEAIKIFHQSDLHGEFRSGCINSRLRFFLFSVEALTSSIVEPFYNAAERKIDPGGKFIGVGLASIILVKLFSAFISNFGRIESFFYQKIGRKSHKIERCFFWHHVSISPKFKFSPVSASVDVTTRPHNVFSFRWQSIPCSCKYFES